ncbi:hypothetical protein UFOVP952_51 [uncultured Caudovirales phage]|uniref:Uncharacterized protein n=1 Tax=uncultured Caudovirales phage TaxID=2100421 RepID=A0A6J7XG84_9CAUD|nr:hypothetical protein UFOVP952_51 [uncultured Caudovirales phage]CAB4204261.1 hypothetical protein UFOVP1392_41 [uncultured Caudovirales phage]CAB5230147.1 hypothetical protein UFOVP1569_40 [uncultured Caudovirales phage]
MSDDDMDRLIDWENREEDRLRLLDDEWEYRLTEPFPKTDDEGEKDA